ncbi:hypothetical protein TNCT_455031 [Trichonephila clavata]|uniref:Uncharacterized protein n=1 Tax=Trichonephila clavata TaxID=2740835 RepID=A0A8X6LBA5_TRICU|nr:hypothetical protein TNCT_455031 [Trichonephila clavata]
MKWTVKEHSEKRASDASKEARTARLGELQVSSYFFNPSLRELELSRKHNIAIERPLTTDMHYPQKSDF